MIVVDSSALLAILKGEADAERYLKVFEADDEDFSISTASLLEAFVAAERRVRRAVGGELLKELARDLRIFPVAFDVTQMAWAMEGYERFGQGRGSEPAALNFGDCFSYALAKALDAPLLFKGGDFSQTDVKAAALPD